MEFVKRLSLRSSQRTASQAEEDHIVEPSSPYSNEKGKEKDVVSVAEDHVTDSEEHDYDEKTSQSHPGQNVNPGSLSFEEGK